MRSELPPDQFEYVKIMLLRGKKPREISRPMGVKNDSVRSVQSQLRKEMKK